MKSAKQEFDSLIAKAKQGNQIKFGEAELLFANAFLRRYFQNLTSKKERDKAWKAVVDQKREQDEDFDEECRYDPSQYAHELDWENNYEGLETLIESELEKSKTVIGTLGVRPDIETLQPYIDYALKKSDWDLLKKVLNISREGELTDNSFEKIAIKNILCANTRALEKLKEKFGDIKFSKETIADAYKAAFAMKEFGSLGKLSIETKTEIPKHLCQSAYINALKELRPEINPLHPQNRIPSDHQNYLNEDHIDDILNFQSEISNQITSLRNTSKVDLVFDDSLRADIGSIIQRQDDWMEFIVLPEFVKNLDSTFGIFNDKKISKSLQETALEKQRYDLFKCVFERTDYKAPQYLIDKFYDNSVYEIESLIGALKEYSKEAKDFELADMVRNVFVKTLKVPSSRKARDLIISKLTDHDYFKQSNIDNLSKALSYFKDAGKSFDHKLVQTYGAKVLANYVGSENYSHTSNAMLDLFNNNNIAISTELLSNKVENEISCVCSELKNLEHHTCGGEKHILNPVKGKNISLFNKFRQSYSKEIKSLTKSIEEYRLQDPDLEISHLSKIQNVYAKTIELMLAEAMVNKPLTNLNSLMSATKVPMDSDSENSALVRHIQLNHDNPFSENFAETILSKINNAGIKLAIDQKAHTVLVKNIIYKAYNKNSNRAEIGSQLKYLNKLINLNFSEDSKEEIRKYAVRSLAFGDIKFFDQIKDLIKINEFSSEETDQLSKGLSAFFQRERDSSDVLIYLTKLNKESDLNITLSVSDTDFTELVNKYLHQHYHNSPNLLGKLFNKQLPMGKVQMKYVSLIEDCDYGWEFKRDYVNNLFNDTKILPTSDWTKKVILDKPALSDLFIKDIGFKFSQEDLEDVCNQICTGRYWIYSSLMDNLLDTHIDLFTQSIADKYFGLKSNYSSWQVHIDRDADMRAKKLIDFGFQYPDKNLETDVTNALKRPGEKNSNLIHILNILNEVYQRSDLLTEDIAKKAVNAMETEFRVNFSEQNRTSTPILDIYYIYKIAGAEQVAKERAKEMFNEDNSKTVWTAFSCYAYCAITGAKPDVPVDVLKKFKEGLFSYKAQHYFLTEQKNHFNQMLDEWIQDKSDKSNKFDKSYNLEESNKLEKSEIPTASELRGDL